MHTYVKCNICRYRVILGRCRLVLWYLINHLHKSAFGITRVTVQFKQILFREFHLRLLKYICTEKLTHYDAYHEYVVSLSPRDDTYFQNLQNRGSIHVVTQIEKKGPFIRIRYIKKKWSMSISICYPKYVGNLDSGKKM